MNNQYYYPCGVCGTTDNIQILRNVKGYYLACQDEESFCNRSKPAATKEEAIINWNNEQIED